ncbi:hypothetical protein Tco_0546577 [Tanacetum coccineum]
MGYSSCSATDEKMPSLSNLLRWDDVLLLNKLLCASIFSLMKAEKEWFGDLQLVLGLVWAQLAAPKVSPSLNYYLRRFGRKVHSAEEDNEPDDITDIFKIKGNLFDYETPLCKAFNDFNYLLKINTDLFTFDIQGIKTYEEYELNNTVIRDLEELWSNNGVPYQLSTSDGTGQKHDLFLGSQVGNATPYMMKFCAWLINSFGNFHELDNNVLVKLQECWWKINAHEVTPFTRMESYGQRPYANFKTKKAHDPYLEINSIFGRNYDISNAGNTQENQGHEERMDDPTLEPSVCKIRRFEMMKYSFNADEEYISIKETEYLNHSKDNLDAYQELLRIIDEGWVMATPDEE